jgi:hypothetical protein
VTSIARRLNLPPIPEIPEHVRGRALVVVEATFLTDEAAASELLAPLRALGPELDTFATMPASELHHLHMDPEHPVPGSGDGMMLAELAPETVEAFAGAVGPGSPLLFAEIRHLGGRIAVASPENGALASFEAPFLVFGVGIAPTPAAVAAVDGAVDVLKSALAPWAARQRYLNFAERVEDNARGFYTPAAYRRLREVKAQVDPANLFRSNHEIPPAAQQRDERRRISRPARIRNAGRAQARS